MAAKPHPLTFFDHRLYLTAFPHPPPHPDQLNLASHPPRTKIRNPPHSALSTAQDDSSSTPSASSYYWFTIDNELRYLSFFQDWGPLNLAMVYKACILIHELLEDEDLKHHKLILYSSDDPRRKANAALLMALYVMIVLRRAPWEAFQPLAELEFIPFRDAGRGPSDFHLGIQDCLWGIWKAMQNGLCDMNEFSVEDYEYYEKVENGDWNWITPGFIAFASPVDTAWIKREKEARESMGKDGVLPESPTRGHRDSAGRILALQRKLPTPYLNCLDYFEKRNVKLVVRLNNRLYDRQTFLDHGIDHMELYFDDGTNPTDEIVRKFIDVADRVIEDGGAVAVHCKAGLGRTGTLIGAYLIWKYKFSANEAIGFMRIVRPGSVVGPQQQYMYLKQQEWLQWGAIDEYRRNLPKESTLATEVVTRTSTTKTEVTKVVTPVTPPADTDEEMAEVALMATPPRAGSESLPPLNGESSSTTATITTSIAVPVTPSRHIAIAQAKAREIAPPGQPRKTPKGKRPAADSDDELGRYASADEQDLMDDEARDILPALQVGSKAKKARLTNERPALSRKQSADSLKGTGTKKGVPSSEARPTRVTRSVAAGQTRKAGTVVRGVTKTASSSAIGATSRNAAAAASSSSSTLASPNKIPRLHSTRTTATTTGTGTGATGAKAGLASNSNSTSSAGTTTRGTTTTTSTKPAPPAPTTTRRLRPPASPSAVPSRLPTLTSGTKPQHTNSMSEVTRVAVEGKAGAKGKGGVGSAGGTGGRTAAADSWITKNAANAVVVPGSKSERPGLRNVRRRRSSFSAADVVA